MRENSIYVIGDIGDIVYTRDNQALVKVKTEREGNKVYDVLVKMDKENKLIGSGRRVYIKGRLEVDYYFCGDEKKFAYIVPEKIKLLDKDFNIQKLDEFYKDYTAHNRIYLKGEIGRNILYRAVNEKGGVYKFTIIFDNGKHVIHCDVWDNVNNSKGLQEGLKVGITGLFSVSDVHGKKGRYKLYKILVQKLDILD